MKIILTTLNAKYIHKSLALRWLYVSAPKYFNVLIKEYTINEDLKEIAKELMVLQPDVIGLSVYIWNALESKEIIKYCKEINPEVRIILGGPEVTYDNDEWFDYDIEAIVLGEGEFVFWDYLLNKEEALNYVKVKPQEYKQYAKADINRLEQLESPYLLEMDLKEMTNRYLYVETSRGCPYRCAYCLSSLDNQVRYFSLQYLLELFTNLEKFPLRQVKFLDRTYNSNQTRAMEIARKLVSNPQPTTYQFEIVADTLNEEFLEEMVTPEWVSRFRYEVGIQSFYSPALEAINRYQDNEKLKEIITYLNNHQVVLHTDLIAGLPYEDYLQFQDSFQQLRQLDPAEIQLGILKLLKGTSLRQQANEYKFQYEENVPYEVSSTKWLTAEEMTNIKTVADAVERTYNKKRLRYTINELSKREIFPNDFSLFLRLAKAIRTLPRPYQLFELFEAVYKELSLEVDEVLLKQLLVFDYYYKVKQRPRELFNTLSKEQRQKVRKQLLENDFLTEKELFQYTTIEETYYNGNVYYLVVVYSTTQSFAQRYLVNKTCDGWELLDE